MPANNRLLLRVECPRRACGSCAKSVKMGFMGLHTAFTEFFSLQHPIALAPMGGASGGAIAAAVSNGGGLGLLGGGRQDPGWLDH